MMNLVALAQILVVASLTWGTLAFGATYEWASRPLAILAVLAGAACVAAGWRAPAPRNYVIAAMAVLLCAIGVQLVPVSQVTLSSLNPERHHFLQRLYLGYRFNPMMRHPLSINPPLTWWALSFCAASFLWIVGLSKLLAVTGAKWLVKSLTLLAALIAVVGIVQNAVYDGRLYGFWTPEDPYAGPFGPFVNKNHFAGWMLMVLPLTYAWLRFEGDRHHGLRQSTWRDRLLWLSSKRASRLILICGSLAVMLMALLLTMSRSGILSLLVTLAIAAVAALRGHGTRLKKTLTALTPVVATALTVAWIGPGAISDRFRTLTSGDLRLDAWADAIAIGQRFSLAGTGLNTYGTATLLLQERLKYMHFAQAHNDYLQLWVEGGVLLVTAALLLAAALLAQTVSRFRESSERNWFRRGAIVGIIAIAMQEAVDFSLQMPANLLLLATLCVLAIYPVVGAPRERKARS